LNICGGDKGAKSIFFRSERPERGKEAEEEKEARDHFAKPYVVQFSRITGNDAWWSRLKKDVEEFERFDHLFCIWGTLK
jgi:hypothetical protein